MEITVSISTILHELHNDSGEQMLNKNKNVLLTGSVGGTLGTGVEGEGLTSSVLPCWGSPVGTAYKDSVDSAM